MKKLLAAVAVTAFLFAPATPRSMRQRDQTGRHHDRHLQGRRSTLDPAIGYDWQNWSMIKSLFNGLMDYKPGTTELVADLAESVDIAPIGLTYVFKLHKGVKFHNGRELVAGDIKYSIERTVNPKTQSPGPASSA